MNNTELPLTLISADGDEIPVSPALLKHSRFVKQFAAAHDFPIWGDQERSSNHQCLSQVQEEHLDHLHPQS